MFYLNQLSTLSFSIGLAKNESGFFRSVETGLGWWMLVIAVISVDAFLFVAFSDLNYHLEHMGIGVSWLFDSMETELGSSNQEASPSAGKKTGVVFVSCLCMEVCPYSHFRWCGYYWGPWASFVTTHDFSVRVTKITSRITVSWTHNLPFYF